MTEPQDPLWTRDADREMGRLEADPAESFTCEAIQAAVDMIAYGPLSEPVRRLTTMFRTPDLQHVRATRTRHAGWYVLWYLDDTGDGYQVVIVQIARFGEGGQ